MDYDIQLSDEALRDLAGLERQTSKRIFGKIERLRHGLAGDVKRLKSFCPGFRLRVGDYRVLFDLHGATVIIQYVRHRRDAYRG
jgi:mRNA interferase RelE/StbE